MWIFNKQGAKAWTGFNWLKLLSSGWILWTRQWTFGLYRSWGTSLPADGLASLSRSPHSLAISGRSHFCSRCKFKELRQFIPHLPIQRRKRWQRIYDVFISGWMKRRRHISNQAYRLSPLTSFAVRGPFYTLTAFSDDFSDISYE
jgi:hypothetical protein